MIGFACDAGYISFNYTSMILVFSGSLKLQCV